MTRRISIHSSIIWGFVVSCLFLLLSSSSIPRVRHLVGDQGLEASYHYYPMGQGLSAGWSQRWSRKWYGKLVLEALIGKDNQVSYQGLSLEPVIAYQLWSGASTCYLYLVAGVFGGYEQHRELLRARDYQGLYGDRKSTRLNSSH